LTPFQVDHHTGTIPKARTKWREENEEVSLKTTFKQLLLEDRNNDPSPPPLGLSSSENPPAFPVTLGPQEQQWHEPICIELVRKFRDSVGKNGANGP
jgi:hypothetical protein